MASCVSRFCLVAAILLAAPIVSPRTAMGADEDNFFEKGFAGEVLEQREPDALPRQGNPKLPGPKGKLTPKPTPKSGDGFEEGGEGPNEPDSIVPEVTEEPGAIPIVSVDGVINFTKIEHAKAIAKFVAEISRERGLRFNKIYALGSKAPVLAALDGKTRIAFTTAITKIVQTKSLPSGITVKGSPSWIINTERGRYIAEGNEALERVTTKSGKLKWPKEAGGPPPPMATPNLSKQLEQRSAEERIQALVGSLKDPPKSSTKKSPKRK